MNGLSSTESECRGVDRWAGADAYERYMGRWSRGVAREFLVWLRASPDLRWLDVGCGTGALTSAILGCRTAAPSDVWAVDASAAFVDFARASIFDPRARLETASVESLPFEDGTFDVVVSGLLLNFVSQPPSAVREMARVSRHEGVVAAYVWDYRGEMQPLRHFWDAVLAVVPGAADLDEVRRFGLCEPERLRALFSDAGLGDVDVQALDRPTTFRDFEDYWSPFLEGRGAAPAYLMSLPERDRFAVEDDLRRRLPRQSDGSIELITRAWAVRGRS